jgi:hypothetical protein
VGLWSNSQEGFPIFIHNSKDVLECLCGDDVWCIEGCPPKLNVQCSTYKRTRTTIARPKLFQKEYIVAFILLVMLAIRVLLKVQQLNFTNFGFVMTTKIVMSKALKGSMQSSC